MLTTARNTLKSEPSNLDNSDTASEAIGLVLISDCLGIDVGKLKISFLYEIEKLLAIDGEGGETRSMDHKTAHVRKKSMAHRLLGVAQSRGILDTLLSCKPVQGSGGAGSIRERNCE